MALVEDALEGLCAFRGPTLEALGAPGLGDRLGASLTKDPLAPVLDAKVLAEVDVRRTKLEALVRDCGDRLVRLP